MSFANYTKEPRQSEIPQRFDPVYRNGNGHNLLKFNTPNHNFRKLALEENGRCLEGRINGILSKGL